MNLNNIKQEIKNLIASHSSIINEDQSFRQYIRKCQKEKINNEERVVQPFIISFLIILNYFNQQNLTIEEEEEGNKPDFHTEKFILECKSSRYREFSVSLGGEETPLEQLKRYLKSNEFKREYGILCSFDRFEVFMLKNGDLIKFEDLSFSLVDFYEDEETNIDNFIKIFYASPITREEKLNKIIKTERDGLIPVKAKQFNKILKSLKNFLSLALVENYKKLDETSDDVKLIKVKICDIKKQMDLSLSQAEKEYISQTAFIYLSRLILTKSWEDLEIIAPPNTYNGGFENYLKTSHGKINEVFQIAINKSQNLYHLFDPSNPYLLIELPDELIIDVLFEFCKYDFRTLNYDILGYVYEDYLDKENRKNFGQFYTPPYIVRLILDRVGYVHKTTDLLDDYILDPASGSGTFLLNAVKRVIESKKDGQDHSIDYKKIVENKIFGSELMLFPYLLSEINILLQFSEIIKKIIDQNKKLNVLNVFPNNSFNLIGKKYGSRLFNMDVDDITGDQIMDPTITQIKKIKLNKFKQNNNFDYVVGNPPYVGNDTNPELFQEMKRKFTFCEKTYHNKMDLFYWFVIVGILKLRPRGKLCFITTRYWISKGEKTGVEKLKQYILENCYVREVIDLVNVKIFASAKGQDNVILLLEKISEDNSDSKIRIFEINPKPKEGECEIPDCPFPNGYCENEEEYMECLCNRNNQWNDLIDNQDLPLGTQINAYYSARQSSDLKMDRSWDIFYKEGGIIDSLINELENNCYKIIKKKDIIGKVTEEQKNKFIKDYFQIRNGITTIADEYFILKDESLKDINGSSYIKIETTKDMNLTQKNRIIEEYEEIYIRVKKRENPSSSNEDILNAVKTNYIDSKGILWLRVTEKEINKLKDSYKTPAIYRHGLNKAESIGKMIFFNKEAKIYDCPSILIYLRQYKNILIEKLKGYNEWTQKRPDKWVTIRRGGSVKLWDKKKMRDVETDLENYYDSKPKIIFNYRMKNNNIFGFYDKYMVATSDIYFFHQSKEKIEIPYILAYLNSKLISFFFEHKPIEIMRSKSNIENDVPVYLPRNDNEGILCNYISKIERKLIKTLQEMENDYRLQGFDYDFKLREIEEIKVNFEKYVEFNQLDLPTINDKSYKLNIGEDIESIDRESFPIIIENPKKMVNLKSPDIITTEKGIKIHCGKIKLNCTEEIAKRFEKIINNFFFIEEKKRRIEELLNLHILTEEELKEIHSKKEKIFEELREMTADEKSNTEDLIKNILEKGEINNIEKLSKVNEMLYFIDLAFILMIVPEYKDFLCKNY